MSSASEGYMHWSEAECRERLEKDMKNSKARYRLAVIMMGSLRFKEASSMLKQIDEGFMKF